MIICALDLMRPYFILDQYRLRGVGRNNLAALIAFKLQRLEEIVTYAAP